MARSKTALLFDQPARTFHQDRARKTFEALLDAAAALFAERGFDATQTPDIAARACVGVGTFYRYFDDKKAIYLEVTRRQLAHAHHAVMDGLTPERFAGKGPRATIDEALRVFLKHLTQRSREQRLFVEMALRDADVAELKAKFDRAAREQIAALIAVICPRDVVPDPAATAYVIQVAVVECATSMAGVLGPAPVSKQRAFAALAAMVSRTLFGSEV